MVLQSSDDTGGFHLMTYAVFKQKNQVVAMFELGDLANVGLQTASLKLGHRYDYLGLFGMAWVLLGRWLKRKWRNPWESSKALTCAEAVVYILQESDYPGARMLDPSSVTPQDILDFIALRQQPMTLPAEGF